ncbi:MAG: hypothetical protein RL095_2519 [Verrucomicrobiota bacterium]|jgi:hypothetical protein
MKRLLCTFLLAACSQISSSAPDEAFSDLSLNAFREKQLRLMDDPGFITWYEGRRDGYDFFTIQTDAGSQRFKIRLGETPISLVYSKGEAPRMPIRRAHLIQISSDDCSGSSQCSLPAGMQGPPIRLKANEKLIEAYRYSDGNRPVLPIGSIVEEESGNPQRLARRMTRITSKGEVSDWRFEVVELPSGRRMSSDAASCVKCHSQWKNDQCLSTHAWGWISGSVNKFPPVEATCDQDPPGL